jgi:hypothetical protein
MSDLTIRKYFYDEVTVNGSKELDYLTTRLNTMELNSATFYRVDIVTEKRPDLISMKFYGTYHLGWLIAEHNNLQDPIEDLVMGLVIKIPSITEYYQYYNRNSRKV